MAGETRATGDPLTDDLVERAGAAEFFQVVRLLERAAPHAARVGHLGPASREVVRFRPDPSLAFPATDIAELSLVEAPGGARFRLTTTFLGLYGSTSPLPSYYAEDLLAEDAEHERLRAFLDLFHHRLISLLYRCWSKYRHGVQFEYGEADRITPRLFALVGLATQALRDATALPSPERLLHFGGLLGRQPRSAVLLENLLTEYFDGLPVEIEQCVGRWTEIPERQQCRLGRQGCRLGSDATIGRRVFARAIDFRIWLGPLDDERLQDFLPGREPRRVLEQLAAVYANQGFGFDIGLRVKDPSPAVLGGDGPRPTRLGWNSWLAPPAGRERRVIPNGRLP